MTVGRLRSATFDEIEIETTKQNRPSNNSKYLPIEIFVNDKFDVNHQFCVCLFA